ncbi:SPT3 Dosage dependent suppressor of Ty-induced promoter mutations-like protein [Mycoemilia scoparia]|uniref:SPT3 Dosage dependent suppressor of Ty-induced promoter mutations-like protein n=1 Tax=Mycoemilia scoparia TaxID=417184 RepID=A0A9W8A6T7_9FUNG|nr:SPT3 Dosage dependent suppressor of Ty-induced promoter mutations-like protein [Mycoemilia scoparia]
MSGDNAFPTTSRSPGSTSKLYQSYQTTRPSPLSQLASTNADLSSFLFQSAQASPSNNPGTAFSSTHPSPMLSASRPKSPPKNAATLGFSNANNQISSYGSHQNLLGLSGGDISSINDLQSPGLAAMAAQLVLSGGGGGSNASSVAHSANVSPNPTAYRRNLMSSLASMSMAPLPPTGPLAQNTVPLQTHSQISHASVPGMSTAALNSMYPVPAVGVSDPSAQGFGNSLEAYMNQSMLSSNPGIAPGVNKSQPYLAPTVGADFVQQAQQLKAQGLKLQLDGIPEENAKSRVETQIKLTLRLLGADGKPVSCWSHLQLPELLVSREKFRHRLQKTALHDQNMPSSEQHILHLEAKVICANKPTYNVETCHGCIRREYKRSLRRKENRIRSTAPSTCTTPNQSRPGSPLGDPALGKPLTGNMDIDWDENRIAIEKQRIIIFNCNDILDFSKGEIVLPTRITCYCRHHSEKVGFCVCLSLRDYQGDVVASVMSPPIMITDDHKSTKFKQDRKIRGKAEYDRPGIDLSHILPAGSVAPSTISAGNLHVVEGSMGPYKGSRQTMSARNSPALRPQMALFDSYSHIGSLAGTPSLGNTPIQSPRLGAVQFAGDLSSQLLGSGSLTPHGMTSPAFAQAMQNSSQLLAMSAALSNQGTYSTGVVPSQFPVSNQHQGTEQGGMHRRSASINLLEATGATPATASISQSSGQPCSIAPRILSQALFNTTHGNASMPGSGTHTPIYPRSPAYGQTGGAFQNYGQRPMMAHITQALSNLNSDPNSAQNSNGMGQTIQKSASSTGISVNSNVGNPGVGNDGIKIESLSSNVGPVAGGTEITVRGKGFTQDVFVMFGTHSATGVKVLNTNTLICVLPSSQLSGAVPVYVQRKSADASSANPNVMPSSYCAFQYVEDTDKTLVELALRVLGVDKLPTISNDNILSQFISNMSHEASNNDGSNGQDADGSLAGTDIQKNDTNALQRAEKAASLPCFQVLRQSIQSRDLANIEDSLFNLFISLAQQNLITKETLLMRHKATQKCLLHLCALLGMMKLANFLVQSTSTVEITDRNLYTPLHFAACFGRSEIAALLLNYGASSSAKASNGVTPVDLARSNNQNATLMVLQEREGYLNFIKEDATTDQVRNFLIYIL